MPPVVHLVLLVFSFCCFAFSAVGSPPNWNKAISIGLASLVASMISW